MLRNTLLALTILASSAASIASAKTLNDVTLPDELKVGESTLKLNGIAVRKKLFVSVYVGGLYLAAPARSEDEVVQPDTPKALVMHFVHDVPADKLKSAFQDGFKNNTKDKGESEKANIAKLLGAISDVKKGDVLKFVYDPAQGSSITLPNGKSETFVGKGFADAFLLVYVGKEPPTGDLKKGLLGK